MNFELKLNSLANVQTDCLMIAQEHFLFIRFGVILAIGNLNLIII